MAEGGSGARGCLIAVGVVGALAVLSCGCAGLLGIFMGPSMLVDAMVEDEPLESNHAASGESGDRIRDRVMADLRDEDRTARITGPELTSMMRDAMGDKGRGGVSIHDGVVGVDFSMNLAEKPTDDPAWINLHAVGRFEYQAGLFTDAHLEAFSFSGWDLSDAMGDDAVLVQQLNQQLIRQRMENPDLDQALDDVERARSDRDAIEVTVSEAGQKRLGG